MVEIMSYLHQYVPCIESTKDVRVQANGEVVSVPQATFHSIVIGGDHLTAATARGAKKAGVNLVTPVSHLEGMIPCAEDWHARLNL